MNFEVTAFRFLGYRSTGRVNATNIELLIPGGKRQVATPFMMHSMVAPDCSAGERVDYVGLAFGKILHELEFLMITGLPVVRERPWREYGLQSQAVRPSGPEGLDNVLDFSESNFLQ